MFIFPYTAQKLIYKIFHYMCTEWVPSHVTKHIESAPFSKNAIKNNVSFSVWCSNYIYYYAICLIVYLRAYIWPLSYA